MIPQLVKTYGAGGGVRTHELLRERITYRDPIVCYDLKSAAFDRAWLLPLKPARPFLTPSFARRNSPHDFAGTITALQLFGDLLL